MQRGEGNGYNLQANLRKFAGGETNIRGIPLLKMVDDTIHRSGPALATETSCAIARITGMKIQRLVSRMPILSAKQKANEWHVHDIIRPVWHQGRCHSSLYDRNRILTDREWRQKI